MVETFECRECGEVYDELAMHDYATAAEVSYDEILARYRADGCEGIGNKHRHRYFYVDTSVRVAARSAGEAYDYVMRHYRLDDLMATASIDPVEDDLLFDYDREHLAELDLG